MSFTILAQDAKSGPPPFGVAVSVSLRFLGSYNQYFNYEHTYMIV